jgi:hypothetical protein
MFNELTEQAAAELAAQNECSLEEFNYKLAGQIDFAMSTLNDLSVSVSNSLIAQTEEGHEIRNDLLKSLP